MTVSNDRLEGKTRRADLNDANVKQIRINQVTPPQPPQFDWTYYYRWYLGKPRQPLARQYHPSKGSTMPLCVLFFLWRNNQTEKGWRPQVSSEASTSRVGAL